MLTLKYNIISLKCFRVKFDVKMGGLKFWWWGRHNFRVFFESNK